MSSGAFQRRKQRTAVRLVTENVGGSHSGVCMRSPDGPCVRGLSQCSRCASCTRAFRVAVRLRHATDAAQRVAGPQQTRRGPFVLCNTTPTLRQQVLSIWSAVR